MSNPLVGRILNNPLTFVAAKNLELEDQPASMSSYIVLSASGPSAPAAKADKASEAKKERKPAPKPKSLADTLAEYTGKKLKAKPARRRARQKVRQDESSDDTQYESASEFHTDSSFHGFRSSADEAESALASGNEDVAEGVSDEETVSASSDATITPRGEPRVKRARELGGPRTAARADVALSRQPERLVLEGGDHGGYDRSSDDDDYDYDAKESSHEEDGAGSDPAEDLGKPVEFVNNGRAASAHEANESRSGNSDDSDDPDVSTYAEETDAGDETGYGGDMSKDELAQLKEDLLTDARGALGNSKQPSALPQPAELPSSPAQVDNLYRVGETPSDTEEAGRIARTWAKSFQNRKPVGLINFGVTCYMNSAIQTMIHIPAVQQYLLAVQANKHKQLPPRSVTHTFAELSARMWGLLKEKHSKYINPKKMVQRLEDINCMMSEWQQEDSHEYFMSLMSRLQEDSTPKGKKLRESVIYDIFGGLLEQEVVCQECKSDSITKQEFYDLSLGFNKRRLSNEVSADDNAPKYSIERAIRDFFSLETIRPDKSDASSGYYCEKCRKRTVATKKSTVEKSPQTLLVHMKRFKFNGNSSLKVKQPIVYHKYLDLGKFSRQAEPMIYQLISVIVHEGRSILSGHYVAHCMQPDGTWATYDDEYINKIDARSALNDPSAYCLLYTKLRARSKRRAESVLLTPTKRAKL